MISCINRFFFLALSLWFSVFGVFGQQKFEPVKHSFSSVFQDEDSRTIRGSAFLENSVVLIEERYPLVFKVIQVPVELDYEGNVIREYESSKEALQPRAFGGGLLIKETNRGFDAKAFFSIPLLGQTCATNFNRIILYNADGTLQNQIKFDEGECYWDEKSSPNDSCIAFIFRKKIDKTSTELKVRVLDKNLNELWERSVVIPLRILRLKVFEVDDMGNVALLIKQKILNEKAPYLLLSGNSDSQSFSQTTIEDSTLFFHGIAEPSKDIKVLNTKVLTSNTSETDRLNISELHPMMRIIDGQIYLATYTKNMTTGRANGILINIYGQKSLEPMNSVNVNFEPYQNLQEIRRIFESPNYADSNFLFRITDIIKEDNGRIWLVGEKFVTVWSIPEDKPAFISFLHCDFQIIQLTPDMQLNRFRNILRYNATQRNVFAHQSILKGSELFLVFNENMSFYSPDGSFQLTDDLSRKNKRLAVLQVPWEGEVRRSLVDQGNVKGNVFQAPDGVLKSHGMLFNSPVRIWPDSYKFTPYRLILGE